MYEKIHWRLNMYHDEINSILNYDYESHEYSKELSRISNQIKSSFAIKTLKTNLRNFIASTNIA